MAKDRNRSGFAFGFGLLLGGIAGYFLASDQGKEFTGKAKKKLEKAGTEIGDKARQEMEKLSAKMDEVLLHSKSVADQLEVKVKEGTKKTANTVDEVVEKSVDSFKKGVDKARKNLDANKA